MVVLTVILLVPLLLQRLKIPTVIGLILAGLAIGPYGFNVVARDMSFQVFGQVGILYLMFLAGLEIDIFNFKKNMHKGLTFGMLTFLIPLLLGAIVSITVLELDPLASMLLASMFAAHTLLAYPIVRRFGLTKSVPVIVAVSGTIVTVLGSLIVLAAVVSTYRDGSFSLLEMLRLMVVIALFCIATGYIYPIITRAFLKRYMDGVLQFIFILSLVFLAAVIAIKIGIEGVFGAFFAGLLLNRFIPKQSPLMSRVEFVGNAIFIPYFLIGVGMLINLSVVFQSHTTIRIAAVMSIVAMVGKWLAAGLTQLIFRLSGTERSLIYQLSNAHTAVALAVVTIGFDMDLFSEDILNATIMMILVTCSVSSVGTERAARKLKIKHLTEAKDSHLKGQEGQAAPTKTLVTVSNPITAPQLVELALLLRSNNPVQRNSLFVLHIRMDNSPTSIDMGRNALDVAMAAVNAVEVPMVPVERFDNNFVSGVLNTMNEREITEVIIGLHRRSNIIDSFFGSKIEQLLNATMKTVVITRCFIPVNTVTRIVVYVPEKAELETGFHRWVEALASLTRELGCRMVVNCFDVTRDYIERVLAIHRLSLPIDFVEISRADDYVMLPSQVNDDDLLVVVSARRASLSFNSEMDSMPDFMQRYLSRNNLILIYPEQFGREPDWDSMAATMATDFVAPPISLWTALRSRLRRSPKHPEQNA